MAQSKAFGKLKSLELKHNYLLDNGTVALAQSDGFPNLEKLSLGWNEVRDAGALAFAKTKTFPKLKKLGFARKLSGQRRPKILSKKIWLT